MKRNFSIRQGKYNVKFIQNDAIAAIIPHKYEDHLLLHIEWNQSLKTVCPSANQSMCTSKWFVRYYIWPQVKNKIQVYM